MVVNALMVARTAADNQIRLFKGAGKGDRGEQRVKLLLGSVGYN